MGTSENRFPFSVNQALFRRNNPDGSRVTISRIMGFDTTIDVSGLGASQEVTIKIDDGAEETNTVSLAAVVTDTAATVAELVTAFTTAAFTDMTFSADAGTGRFLAVYSGAGDPRYVQIYDDGSDTLVVTMDIGQGFGGKILVKDNLLSASHTANLKDKEEIETEDGNGSITSVEFPAELKGLDPTVSLQTDDPELKAMLIGGSYDSTTETYSYPSQNAEPPLVQLEVFQQMYEEGVNKRRDFTRVKRTEYFSGTASPADLTADAKTWSSIDFSMSFPDYLDPVTAARIGPALEEFMSVAEYNSIDWSSL